MIPKPGKNHSIPENHRPISLLPTISKVFEKIILGTYIHKTSGGATRIQRRPLNHHTNFPSIQRNKKQPKTKEIHCCSISRHGESLRPRMARRSNLQTKNKH